MPSINNIGGSLTSAIILTLLAWGVRVLRATAQRPQNQRKGSRGSLETYLGRFFSILSPAALKMLVGTRLAPPCLVSHEAVPAVLSSLEVADRSAR